MTDEDLSYASAADLSALIRNRQLSPVEIVRSTLARIERAQPVLNAFITVCAEDALNASRDAESAVMRGDLLGPLHGIPFSVKDLVSTEGVRTTYGSLIFTNHVPTADAASVARLKAAGAILVGKTTTPEFGQKGLTDAPLFGRTRNAWRADRTCGGSSGGAAVAVAAGLGPIAVATDGGGSTRIPAACNGVVGFKQSLGVVPHDTADDAFSDISYITPMTRTVMDTALMLDAMAGPHTGDPRTINRVPEAYAQAAKATGDLAGLKVAWRPFLGNGVVAAEVLSACADAVKVFAGLGAELLEMRDDFENAEELWLIVNGSYRLAQHGHHLEQRDRMDPALVAQLDRAGRYSAQELYRAIFLRTRMYRQVQGWFEHADMVVTPTLARTALSIEHKFSDLVEIDGKPVDTMRRAWYPYTLPFNMTGNPAISIPCGWDAAGLPIGLQLVGGLGADAMLLRAAALFEQARPWNQRRPSLPELDA
ncbi:MAG TPA: amidase [Burkholderiales bacterium]|nr:amidase [Burkholderiales bacterium]